MCQALQLFDALSQLFDALSWKYEIQQSISGEQSSRHVDEGFSHNDISKPPVELEGINPSSKYGHRAISGICGLKEKTKVWSSEMVWVPRSKSGENMERQNVIEAYAVQSRPEVSRNTLEK